MFKRIAALAGAAALSAAVVAGAAPTQAATGDNWDGKESDVGYDLISTHLNNRDDRLTITTKHADLTRNPSTYPGGRIYLDTDPSDRAPEYVFLAGYFDGTEYILLKTKGWKPRSFGKRVKGDYSFSLNYRTDRARLVIDQDTIRTPDEVRIAVRMSGAGAPVDWLHGAREWAEPVPRGW